VGDHAAPEVLHGVHDSRAVGWEITRGLAHGIESTPEASAARCKPFVDSMTSRCRAGLP
jgi:hypothetical protein